MNNLHITLYKLHNKLSSELHLSRSSCRACWAVLFDKLDTTKMHGLDTSNVSSRVVSRRDEPSGIWALWKARCCVPTGVIIIFYRGARARRIKKRMQIMSIDSGRTYAVKLFPVWYFCRRMSPSSSRKPPKPPSRRCISITSARESIIRASFLSTTQKRIPLMYHSWARHIADWRNLTVQRADAGCRPRKKGRWLVEFNADTV